MLKLTNEKITKEDIDALCDWLQTMPKLTQSELVKEFEIEFAKKIGVRYATFVNSGSSANLLMISILSRKNVNRGVVVPALSWSTDYAPVKQLGFNPILVDCDLNTLSTCVKDLEKVFKDYSPSAYLHVSVLGFPGPIGEILELCEKYNVILLEDNCESLGSEYFGTHVGNFGLASSFSFYYSHHISTIEGGMVCTNDTYTNNILKSVREHGWTKPCENWYQQFKQDRGDNFKFHHTGYNLRNTEIAAFLGLRALERFYGERVNNSQYTSAEWRSQVLKNSTSSYAKISDGVSCFGVPYIFDDVESGKKQLSDNEIEYRPIIAGSMSKQPMVIKDGDFRNCPNAEIVHELGVYLPCHEDVKIDQYSEILKGV